MQYQEQVVHILPLRTEAHLTDVESYLRHLFRTDARTSCHALNTASYVLFRNDCLRSLQNTTVNRFTASLLDGYRLEHIDGTVVVKRLTFMLSEGHTGGKDDEYI